MRHSSNPKRNAQNVVQITGGQTIGRAIALLKIVTESRERGMTLADISARAGLHRATAHRMLNVLLQERLIEQDEAHRYHPGIDMWVLGEAAARRFNVREFGRSMLEHLAAQTEDTAYLSVRSGFEAICVGRCEGAFPIRTLSLSVGDRRPLGVGSGSLALLAYMPDADREEAFGRLDSRLGDYPKLSTAMLRKQADETRHRGYSFVGGTILAGMSAIGVPVLDRKGEALAALSVAAIESRLAEPRRSRVVAVLKAQARLLSTRLRARGTGEQAQGAVLQHGRKVRSRD